MAQKKIFTAKMGPKGQMTLPKEIRTALEIEEGDRVLLRIEDEEDRPGEGDNYPCEQEGWVWGSYL